MKIRMITGLLCLTLSSIVFAQSAPTREVSGWFTSPAHDYSVLELEGHEALQFMRSRYLWSEQGEKKSVILKNVKFSCEDEAKKRCTFEFLDN